MLYDYNDPRLKLLRVKQFDELGGEQDKLTWQFYDCPCGEKEYTIVSTTSRHQNSFTFVQCSHCGVLRINPYLTEESIDYYYKNVYGVVKRNGMTAEALYQFGTEYSDRMYQELLPSLSKDMKILDFGGGAGGRMDRFLKEGLDVYIEDSDEKYKSYAVSKGLKPHAKDNQYDLVILSHVIEHINHPVPFLSWMKEQSICKGGLLYLEVPYLGVQPTIYYDLHIAHKYYFTPGSLAMIGVKAGFNDLKHLSSGILFSSHSDGSSNINTLDFKNMKSESDKAIEIADKKYRRLKLRKWHKRYKSSRG